MLFQFNAPKPTFNFDNWPAIEHHVYAEGGTPQDVEEDIYRYLKRCHYEGVIYVELMCSRKTYSEMSDGLVANASQVTKDESNELINYKHFVNAIAAGIDRAHNEFDIEARIQMVLLNHNSLESSNTSMEEFLSYRHPYVVDMRCIEDNAQMTDIKDPCIGQEYPQAQSTWGLSNEKMINIIKNSINSSFADDTLKSKLLAHVDLFDVYQKLFEILKHEPNTRSFIALKNLKSICSNGLLNELNYHIIVEFNQGRITELSSKLQECFKSLKDRQERCLKSTKQSLKDFAMKSDPYPKEELKSVVSMCPP